jgi:hypothetical protein
LEVNLLAALAFVVALAASLMEFFYERERQTAYMGGNGCGHLCYFNGGDGFRSNRN